MWPRADEIHGGYPRYKSLTEHKNLVLERLNSDSSVTSSILKQDLPSDSCWYSSSLHPVITLELWMKC